MERAALIRTAQALGFTLRDIAAMNARYGARGITRADQAAILRERLVAIDAQADRLRAMRRYLVGKLAWIEGGERGDPPPFSAAAPRGPLRAGC